MLLNERIKELQKESAGKIPEDAKETMKKATEELVKSGIEDSVLKKGAKAPNFALPNFDGTEFVLSRQLEKGPVLLSFYRGGWCPVCNIELNYLQSRLVDFEFYGASLVAISPEQPEFAEETAKKHEIKFPVLSDLDNKVAKQYGLVFKIPDELVEIYKEFGLDVAKHNGNEKWEIPIPATFLIDKNRVIKYAFGKADYNQRAEPDEIVEVLKTLQ